MVKFDQKLLVSLVVLEAEVEESEQVVTHHLSLFSSIDLVKLNRGQSLFEDGFNSLNNNRDLSNDWDLGDHGGDLNLFINSLVTVDLRLVSHWGRLKLDAHTKLFFIHEGLADGHLDGLRCLSGHSQILFNNRLSNFCGCSNFGDKVVNHLLDLVNINHLIDELGRALHSASISVELAEESGGGLRGFPDLEEGVLGVDAFLFALSTEVVVWALSTLVADTGDGGCFTGVTNDARVYINLLGVLLLVLLVDLHEFLITEGFDLFCDLTSDIAHIFEAELSSLLALATRLTLGVYLGAFALEAGDVVSKALAFRSAFTSGSTFLAGLSFLVDFGTQALFAQ